MAPEKLIEKRGKEPAFLPGHVGESWQRVDFGLGASTLQSSPQVQDSLPPQDRHWGRMIACGLLGGLPTLLLGAVLRRLFH